MTKQEEKFLFQMFCENYGDMPAGDVSFDDKPDVIMKAETGELIGIELTECIYDERLMQRSEFQIDINGKVIAILEERMPFKFFLDIELDSAIPLKQNMIESTIKQLIGICVHEFGNLEPYESRQLEKLDIDWNRASTDEERYFLNLGYRNLPKSILTIEMRRWDKLTKSAHPESKGGVVPNFTQKNLDAILKKKHKALLNYKVCDQQWLLIGEGGDFYSYVDRVEIEGSFSTEFDKVFIYRRETSEVLVLK